MNIVKEIPLLEEILAPWREVIGADYLGYRNHVYRMLNCGFELLRRDLVNSDLDSKTDSSAEAISLARQKMIIAAAFHDIGIWIDQTLDYLPPSLPPAMSYLNENGLSDWSEEVSLMITEHHKIRAVSDARYPLVELFRQADLVDFSLGTVRFGIDRDALIALRKVFPNAGFHRGLLSKAGKWFVKHPLNPAPMMKW